MQWNKIKDFAFYLSVCILLVCSQGEAVIHYNKLQADPKQGKSLDIGIFYFWCTFNYFEPYAVVSIYKFVSETWILK